MAQPRDGADARMSPTLGELLATLGREPLDPATAAALADEPVGGAAPIATAGPHDVTFCTAALADAEMLLAQVQARLLIVDEQLAQTAGRLAAARVPAIVPSPSPRLDFARVLSAHFAPPRPSGVSPHAVIAPGARLGEQVYVGPLATLGEHVVVGDETVIHAGVHVYGPVTIGARVTIHAGTVIGASGYGYERAPDGRLEAFPQIGSVEIGDDVEIGANACIDRGALGATRIQAGARIDNLVHIAHNVHVGRDAAVIAHAMVAGSTRIGDRAWIAPAAALRDKLTIGEDAVVGLGATVVRPVPAGTTVAGNPARELGGG
jgi:UDP-3-O-[3-hydroxymyristoyl] glucosamine N-acyltransferase